MREEMVTVEFTVISSKLNWKLIRNRHQSTTELKLLKSRYHDEEAIRTITIKVLTEKTERNTYGSG